MAIINSTSASYATFPAAAPPHSASCSAPQSTTTFATCALPDAATKLSAYPSLRQHFNGCFTSPRPVPGGGNSVHSKPRHLNRRQLSAIRDREIAARDADLRAIDWHFYSGIDQDMRAVPAPGWPTISSACVSVFSSFTPLAIWTAIRTHNGFEFPQVAKPNGPSSTRIPTPDTAYRGEYVASVGNNNAAPGASELPPSLPTRFPTLGDVVTSLVNCGQKIGDALPYWPASLPTASAEVRAYMNPLGDWRHQKVGAQPLLVPASIATATTTASLPVPSGHPLNFGQLPVKGPLWSSIVQEASIKGVIAYQRWSVDTPQDDRLKGIATERPSDPTLYVDQLVDAFNSVLPRQLGAPGLVNPYQFSVLKYAIQNQLPSGFGDGAPIDPARPQPAQLQAALQAEAAQLFFNILGEISESVRAEAFRGLIRERIQIVLEKNPTLKAFPALIDRIKAEIIMELGHLLPALNDDERATLNTLTGWLVEAEASIIDPLLSSQINLRRCDFGQMRYESDDAALMRIGAAFINQFPAKSKVRLTPQILREVALYGLMDVDPENWPPAVSAALLRLGDTLARADASQPFGSVADRTRAALAFVIEPEMEGIRRLQKVEILEKEYLAKVSDQSSSDGLHQQESQAASRALNAGKFEVYSFGLERLPSKDRAIILEACHKNQLKVYIPKAILYDGMHNGVGHKASFKAVSGLILRTGPLGSEDDAEYYAFSQGRAWGSSVIYKDTRKVKKAGGILPYLRKNHAAFTSGISFSEQTRFETEVMEVKAKNLDGIARAVSDLQGYPSELNKKLFNRPPSSASPQLSESKEPEDIFHSDILLLGEVFFGFFPGGACLIAAVDIAAMIFAPGKTDADLAAQEIALGIDGAFCVSGMPNIGSTRTFVQSLRPAFRYSSSKKFAADKVLKGKLENPSEAGLAFGLFEGGVKPAAASEHVATAPNDLTFMTGISEFFDPSPLKASAYPDIILLHENALNIPPNLVPEGAIQKSEGGPVYLVLSERDAAKRVSYMWNEAERQMERQTPQWLMSYGKFMDRDPKVLALFTEALPQRLSSMHIADRLYDNKCFRALHQQPYHSHLSYPLPEAERGVYTIGKQRYLKHENRFYLLANTLELTATERIVGERMPEDLQLDVYFDGTAWRIAETHLITPVLYLPESVTTFEGALKEGFNLPEGWEATGAYIDNNNSEQFIFSFKDSEGNTVFRRGPNQKNALDTIAPEELDVTLCNRMRRSPVNVIQAGCGTLGSPIAPLSSRARRKAAMDRIVVMDVETRPFYERWPLRLEVARDIEKINNLLENTPGLERQLNGLIDRMKIKPTLDLPEVIQKMQSMIQRPERRAVPVEMLREVSDFWGKVDAQIMIESLGGFHANALAVRETSRLGQQISKNMRTYSKLGRTYSEKMIELNALDNAYKNEFITQKQKVSTRLWRMVFNSVMRSRFITTGDWTFEVAAKGITEIRGKFGEEVAHDFSAVYSKSHILARDMVQWSEDKTGTFWKRCAKYFHVPEEPSPLALSDLVEAVSIFGTSAHPDNMGKLRIVKPNMSPDGNQYRFNVKEQAQGVVQEASLFGNAVAAFTFQGGKRRGELFVTTTTFLTPTVSISELRQTLLHELSHLAIPNCAEEIYLDAARSKYGYLPAGALRHQADVLLESPAAFLKFAEDIPSVKQNFLKHCINVIPEFMKTHFPEGIADGNVDTDSFAQFVIALYKGPAHIKIKAFLMPDFFVGLLEDMAEGLPNTAGDAGVGAQARPKREETLNDFYTPMQRLLVRDAFREGRRKRNS
ncbi:hypothetical protein [Glaciimonas immobilis]|uniref:Uncharacterized protein n=1 Tax=Glaciimonas immobilis TaxID=728004 RepID=A0A840S0Q6_9BURK|nr:hypothetical protein [Glaciimonas immobilis]KAF3997185.1 hypothetical protein HAV38_16120 [Glaciimonas immobilis]MBB5202220.1 hypothetical protein [Glaciimonas immobilis]